MLHIHNLFEIVAKHKYGSVTKKIMYSILSDIMNLRSKIGIRNDVFFLEKQKDQVIEKLSRKYPDISYILEDILDIPEVRAYLDIKREVEDQEDQSEDSELSEAGEDDDFETETESDNSDSSESESDTSDSITTVSDYIILPRSTLAIVVFTSLMNMVLGSVISLKVFNVI